jgi:hypothetical protein
MMVKRARLLDELNKRDKAVQLVERIDMSAQTDLRELSDADTQTRT